MFVQIGQQPQADFTRPIALMMDCHRRIEQFLDVLIRIARTAGGEPMTREERSAMQTAMNYFRSAGPRHNEDEESSLFPRLRGSGHPEAAKVLDAIEQLESEHRRVEVSHQRVDALLKQWLDEACLSSAEASELTRLLLEMREIYRRHIAMEDQQLFPLAQQLLQAGEIQAIGREMAERRAQDPGRPGSRCAARRAAQAGAAHPAAPREPHAAR